MENSPAVQRVIGNMSSGFTELAAWLATYIPNSPADLEAVKNIAAGLQYIRGQRNTVQGNPDTPDFISARERLKADLAAALQDLTGDQ